MKKKSRPRPARKTSAPAISKPTTPKLRAAIQKNATLPTALGDAGFTSVATDTTDPYAELRRLEPQDGSQIDLAKVSAAETEEQRVMRTCGAWLKVLIREPELRTLVGAMTAFRQAYAVTYRELYETLQRLTDKFRAEQLTVPPALADFVVQYAMYQASKPFSEHQLMHAIRADVLPFLVDTIDRHVAAERTEQQEDDRAREETRRAMAIPIGFAHTPLQEIDGLVRDRSLILVGWRNAVSWLLDKACETASTAELPSVVIRLLMSNRGAEPAAQKKHMIRLAGTIWKGCANTERSLALLMGTHVADRLDALPDLLVCDDLSLAYSAGFIGRPPAANAGDAHRRLRKWCDGQGAAFLGALPLDQQELPEFSGEYEQLKTFTHLRPVHVDATRENHYRLTIGNCPDTIDVSRDVLDNYETSRLVV